MVVGAATFVTDSIKVDAKDENAVARTGCLDRGRESESSDGHLSVLAPPIIFDVVVIVLASFPVVVASLLAPRYICHAACFALSSSSCRLL